MKENFKPEFAEKRIWMYWPDAKARQFKENAEKGFMACGLKDNYEIGDLNKIGTKGIRNAILAEYGYLNGASKKLMTEFYSTMKKGDFVIARNEWDNIVGVGIVVGEYYFDDTRSSFKHCRKVHWIDTNIWPFPEELKGNGKWHRVSQIDQQYRKVAEQIITWICEGDDDDTSHDILNEAKEVKKDRNIDSKISDHPIRHNEFEITEESSHSAFVRKARQYQESIVRQWATQFGKVCIWDERPNHGVWLKDEYAKEGLVFYEGFRDEIMSMYHGGKTNISMRLLNNALRSEHIPYNLFYPMMKDENKEATKGFLNELFGSDFIDKILDIKIEFSPQPKFYYLNDGTAFDAYVLYRHKAGDKGAIGIEVKYTEREYSIGDIEYQNTHDVTGEVKLSKHYERATRRSGYYFPNTDKALVSDDLRQIWRNHILGASMVLHGDIVHFSSMTIFPDANPHFHIAPENYRNLLTTKGNSTFFTFTYERMFEVMKHHFCTEKHKAWIKYLYDRYLFGS